MFIELLDVGVEMGDCGEPIRINPKAPEHNKPLLMNVEGIVYMRPITLEDGNVLTEICYDRTNDSALYWVRNSFGEIKTLLNRIGCFWDNNVVPVSKPVSTDDYMEFYNSKNPKNDKPENPFS